MSAMGVRVLVVSRDRELRTLVGRVMREAGHSPDIAADSLEAIEKLDPTRWPGLVLVDLAMPLVDVFAILENAHGGSTPPPCVALGGLSEFEVFARGVQHGLVAFVPKPLHFGTLVSACERVLAEASRSDAPIPGAERRRARRRALMVGVHLLSERGAPLALGELVDLSASGAQLNLLTELELGSRVRVAIDPSFTGQPVRFDAEVRWARRGPAGFAHGVELVALETEMRERLQKILGDPD
jgi:DNA-binding response OmpR family regulator